MSLTLGEKLRQAREERGISISEVAEQTRISPHYLESIEHDDYKTLPGGIFNKGFVKSYAKYVELDEQEALQDYSRAIAVNDSKDEPEMKVYRPEVLTDDRTASSMVPTVIVAVIILGVMTAGILYLVNYLRNQPSSPSQPVATNNSNTTANSGASPTPNSGGVPDMSTLKVEFKAVTAAVSLSSNTDGKSSVATVNPGSVSLFEPKQSLKLSYSKSLASAVQLLINGKAITLPAQPLVPKRATIEFEINKDNLPQIWQNAAISTDVPGAVTDANAVPPTSGPTPVAAPRPAITARPTPAANTAASNSAGVKPAETPKSTSTPKPPPPKPPAGNKPQ